MIMVIVVHLAFALELMSTLILSCTVAYICPFPVRDTKYIAVMLLTQYQCPVYEVNDTSVSYLTVYIMTLRLA